jgi:hypothetical protein
MIRSSRPSVIRPITWMDDERPDDQVIHLSSPNRSGACGLVWVKLAYDEPQRHVTASRGERAHMMCSDLRHPVLLPSPQPQDRQSQEDRVKDRRQIERPEREARRSRRPLSSPSNSPAAPVQQLVTRDSRGRQGVQVRCRPRPVGVPAEQSVRGRMMQTISLFRSSRSGLRDVEPECHLTRRSQRYQPGAQRIR